MSNYFDHLFTTFIVTVCFRVSTVLLLSYAHLKIGSIIYMHVICRLTLGPNLKGKLKFRCIISTGKVMGNQPGKYMICETVSMQLHHSAV